MMNPRTLSAQLINKALEYGASLAGIANIEDLKNKCRPSSSLPSGPTLSASAL